MVSSNVCVTCCRDHYMVSSPLTTVLTRPFKWSYISSCQFVGVWFGLVVVQWFFSECVTRCRDHCKPPCPQPFSLAHWPPPCVTCWPESALATHYHHWPLVLPLRYFDSSLKDDSWHNILCSSQSPPVPTHPFQNMFKEEEKAVFWRGFLHSVLGLPICYSPEAPSYSHTRPSAE